MNRRSRLALTCVLILGGALAACTDDPEIEAEPDGGSGGEACVDGEARACLVNEGCFGVQACRGEVFGECVAPEEVCNGRDDDCDGEIDEQFIGLGAPCHAGEGACRDRGVLACSADGNDVVCNAQPGDGTDEVCDGIDNDCDGEIDDGAVAGVECDTGRPGVCLAGVTVCTAGDTVCEPTAEPSAEVCDGLDNDCDGRTDEADVGGPLARPCYDGPGGTEGVGACAAGVEVCTDGAFGACTEQIVPGDEICDGVDNDCNGTADDAADVECVCVPGTVQPCYGGPEETANVGACRAGTQVCNDDGTGFGACDGQALPGVELCDGADNDCNGVVDDAPGLGEPCGAGQGACAAEGTRVCDIERGQVVCDADPGLPGDEVCNGIDDDCDGLIDDVAGIGEACSVGTGACLARGVRACDVDAGALGCAAEEGAPADEVCNGVDDDCNGVVDDAAGVGDACAVGQGICRSAGIQVCDAAAGAVVCGATEQPAAREACDTGLDEDCDGEVDEDDCIIPCGADDDCPAANLCEDGACVPGDCRADDACGDGALCIDRFCVPGDCRDDAECADGEVCSANTCIPLPAECVDPTVIGDFGLVAGSTVGAGDDFDAGCGARAEDVVYRLDLDHDGPVCITTDGSAYDTKLFARRTCGDAGSELACDDDGGVGVDSRIEIDVVRGEGAFVFVDGFAENAGDFTLRVDAGPCPCRADGECDAGEVCRLGACAPAACGDGVLDADEGCDDGGTAPGDGCDADCAVEFGYACDDVTGACAEVDGAFSGVSRIAGEALPLVALPGPEGEPFENPCGPGQLIVGLEASVDLLGGTVNQARALCADVELAGDRLVLDPAAPTPITGVAPPAPDNRLACPVDHAVVGYVAYQPVGVALICRPIALTDGRLTFGPPVDTEALGLAIVESDRQACPEGTAAAAHLGAAGESNSAFSLRCDAFVDQCAGGSVCDLIGDCIDDGDCAEDQRCADFTCTDPEICDDGVGNNGNGQVDCFDETFCADHPVCVAGACATPDDCGGEACVAGVCATPRRDPLPIAAPGHRVATSGAVDAEDATWDRPAANCGGGGPEGGFFYERRRIINAGPAQQRVTITADWADDDGYLHVFRVPFDPLAVPEGCLAGNDDFGGLDGSRVVDVTLVPGEALEIVASTFTAGDTTAYTLEVFTQPPVEACADGFDNDDDGAVDCDDDDCARTPACGSPEVCDSGEDEDFDGLIDCADPDCLDDEVCEGACPVQDDLEPNDGRESALPIEPGVLPGLAACGEVDAFTFTVCAGGRYEVEARVAEGVLLYDLYLDDAAEPILAGQENRRQVGSAEGEPLQVTIVYAGADAIYDLELVIACPEICDNGEDEDGDGLVDCADDDCAADPACVAPCPDAGVEPNDTRETAVPLDPGRYDQFAICGDGDEDHFAFAGCAGGRLTATISDYGAADLDIFLYDAEGVVLDRGFTLNPTETAEADLPVDAVYVVRVDGAGAAEAGYVLDVQLVCIDPEACGNGELDRGEGCDDGGAEPGDGCDASCQVEDGWVCDAEGCRRFECDVDADCPANTVCDGENLCQPIPGCDDGGDEPNDDSGMATPVEPGVYAGRTLCRADEDVYAIEVCAGGTVEVTLDFTHADGDLDLQLLAADGAELDASRGVADGEAVSHVAGLDPETVYARVYFAENSYDLTVTVDCVELCRSGLDDDGDGDIDCLDADCVDDAACNPLRTDVPLDTTDVGLRTGETNGGDLVADAMLWRAQRHARNVGAASPVAALTNAGGLRGDRVIPVGEVSEDDLATLLPFGNTLVIVGAVERADFVALLENAVSQAPVPAGRFAQIAGFRFVWDRAAPEGARVVSATLDDGTVLVDRGAVVDGPPLTVVTNDFIAADRDGYVFPDAQLDTGIDMVDALRDFFIDSLGGVSTADQYPEGGAGRIVGIEPERADLNCADGVDNDGDGQIDCADPGCVPDAACRVDRCDADADCNPNAVCRDAACVPTGFCPHPDGDIAEPNDVDGDAVDAMPGLTTPLAICGDDRDYFRYTVCPGGTLTIELLFEHDDGDVDLQVVDGPRSASSTDDERVEVTNEGADPVTYVWWAFGFDGASNGYAMQVDVEGCNPDTELVCDDGVDDDLDRLVDCDDPDCADDAACAPPAGALVVTEVMQNPRAVADGSGEWFELYNGGADALDLDGWSISDDGGQQFVIDGPLVVEPGGYLVFANAAVGNGGVQPDYVYANFGLGNGDDEIVLIDTEGVERAAARWDGGPVWPDGNGIAMQFDSRLPYTVELTADGANWCEAITPYGDGDLGTPGAENAPCGPLEQPPLAIAAPGAAIRLVGAIEEADARWEAPLPDCAPRGDGRAYAYETFRIANDTGADQVLDLNAALPDDFSGDAVLHIFADGFDPADLGGCITGGDDGADGDSRASFVGGVGIAAGDVLTVVLTSETLVPDGEPAAIGGVAVPFFGAFTIEVTTVAEAVDFCRLQFPAEIDGIAGDTVTVYGRLYEAGLTDRSPAVDIDPAVRAELGVIVDGADPADPASWSWVVAEANPDWDAAAAGAGDEDEYQAELTLPEEGLYAYAWRFSVDRGATWQLCDLDPGAGADLNADDPASTFDLADAGLMITSPNPCDEACADANACNFLPLVGFATEAECVAACEAGQVSREQAICVAETLDPPNACDGLSLIRCQGL